MKTRHLERSLIGSVSAWFLIFGLCQPVLAQTTYLEEDFSDNSAGWTLGPEWQIGPAIGAPCSQQGSDPAQDHTPTADNGIAGVVIGGCAGLAIHDFYYLQSPTVDATGPGLLFLEFYRHLGSDYTPFMQNRVQVWDGSAWQTIWQSGGPPGINDPTWTLQSYNISAYRNANLRVRMGFDVGSAGVFTVRSWSVDDVRIYSARTATISVAPAAVTEDGSANLVYTVSLDPPAAAPISINYSVGGTATNGSDYAAIASPLVIGTGASTGTITVDPTVDGVSEGDETVVLTLTSGIDYRIGAPGAATGTIQNDDALPVLSIADATVTEGNAGSTTLSFALSLDSPAPAAVGYGIATADLTATAPADYVARSLSGQSIAAGQSSGTFTVTVNADTTLEADETLRVLLSNVTGATLGDGEAIGTIRSDDFRVLRLVDSGQVNCSDASADTGTVSAATPDPEAVGYNEQDCTRGASAADALGRMAKIGVSSARGRDYTKIANDGSELPASATQGPNPGDWGCTRDNLTGLTWELKVNDAASLRHVGHRYTWYETDPRINGGDPGSVGTAGTCNSTLAQCNTSAYRDAINALSGPARLCGASDWRLPTPVEMRSLVDSGFDRSTPPIDILWFPNENGAGYWTDASFAFIPSGAWTVSFIAGALTANLKSNVDAVRLVRGAP
jgi:hypothetical protein